MRSDVMRVDCEALRGRTLRLNLPKLGIIWLGELRLHQLSHTTLVAVPVR